MRITTNCPHCGVRAKFHGDVRTTQHHPVTRDLFIPLTCAACAREFPYSLNKPHDAGGDAKPGRPVEPGTNKERTRKPSSSDVPVPIPRPIARPEPERVPEPAAPAPKMGSPVFVPRGAGAVSAPAERPLPAPPAGDYHPSRPPFPPAVLPPVPVPTSVPAPAPAMNEVASPRKKLPDWAQAVLIVLAVGVVVWLLPFGNPPSTTEKKPPATPRQQEPPPTPEPPKPPEPDFGLRVDDRELHRDVVPPKAGPDDPKTP